MNTWGPGSANPYARPDETRRTMAGLEDYCEDFFPSMGAHRLENLAANSMAADDNEILSPYYADALEAHKKLTERCPGITKRRRVRVETAEYIEAGVELGELPSSYLYYSRKLLAARQWALWGIDTAGELLLSWDGAAGLVKLCPDDAREEGQRVVEQYGDALLIESIQPRRQLRYGVFTTPNVPLGELGAAIDDIQARFRDRILCYRKKKRPFKIAGALTTIEAPLSAGGEWNVHLNALLVFDGWPSYKELRAAWGFNVELRRLGAQGGGRWKPGEQSIRDAIVELVKYPLKAISEKAQAKADGGWTIAPGLTQWPHAAFLEWYEAHRGRRRTRSSGCLYAYKRPEPVPKELTTWAGRLRFYDGVARAAAPILAFARPGTGPCLDTAEQVRKNARDFGRSAVDKSGRSSSDPPLEPAWLD